MLVHGGRARRILACHAFLLLYISENYTPEINIPKLIILVVSLIVLPININSEVWLALCI